MVNIVQSLLTKIWRVTGANAVIPWEFQIAVENCNLALPGRHFTGAKRVVFVDHKAPERPFSTIGTLRESLCEQIALLFVRWCRRKSVAVGTLSGWSTQLTHKDTLPSCSISYVQQSPATGKRVFSALPVIAISPASIVPPRLAR